MKVRGDFLGPPRSTDKTTLIIKVSKGAKIRNLYNQVPHLTQDTNESSTTPDPGYPLHTQAKTMKNALRPVFFYSMSVVGMWSKLVKYVISTFILRCYYVAARSSLRLTRSC